MKNIDLLPISEDGKKRLSDFALQYKKSGKIFIEIISFNEDRLIVRVEQKQIINDKVLTKADLVDRVRDLFNGEIPSDWKLTVSAVDFDRRDILSVDAAWIQSNMERLDIKAKHIATYTGIDKSSLSSYISGERNLSKLAKVAFYYFFKYYERANFK